MAVSRKMKDAFKDGFENPNAPLTPGEVFLLRNGPRAGPRVVFVDAEPEPEIQPAHIGELTYQRDTPEPGHEDEYIDAEIIE